MKSNAYATSLLKLIFTNLQIAGYGDTNGPQPSATAGSFYISLHNADPAGVDDQTTHETAYTSYARVAVARSSTAWLVSGAAVQNLSNITFPNCTGGSDTITHFGVGTASTGAGHLPYSFPLISYYYSCVGTASGNLFTAPGHTLSVNDPIMFINAIGAGGMPGGVSLSTTYYVKSVTGDTFTISATLGGATLTVTSDGAAVVGKIGSLAVSSGITPQFLTGQLLIIES